MLRRRKRVSGRKERKRAAKIKERLAVLNLRERIRSVSRTMPRRETPARSLRRASRRAACAAARCSPLQQRAELGAALRIERRGRLVHQQQRRIDGERARDGDALRLAARQLARQRRGAMLDAERVAAARGRACRASAGATPCACTGARQTLSIAVRCSNRQWNWNTMPTLRRSARSVAVGTSTPPASVTPSTTIRPPETARGRRSRAGSSSCPSPTGPSARPARRARRRSDTPSRIARAPRRRRSVAHARATASLMRWPPSTAARAAAPARRAAATSRDTAPRTACPGITQLPRLVAKICVCLVSSSDGEHRDERRVLQQRDEVVGHRRERQAERLRPADQRQHLPLAEARACAPPRAGRSRRLERRAVDLALVGGVVQRQAEQRRDKRRQPDRRRRGRNRARTAAAGSACRASARRSRSARRAHERGRRRRGRWRSARRAPPRAPSTGTTARCVTTDARSSDGR